MSHDHLVKKTNRPRRYKQPILNSRHIEIFPTGLTHDFGQKLEISCLFSGKISYEIIFDNHLVRKQAFQ